MPKQKHKPYERMNTAELAAATAEHDQPWTGPGLPGKPLTAAQRARHRRAGARAKAGRPKIGGGAQIVPVQGGVMVARRARYTLKELCAGLTAAKNHPEVDWGGPVGTERI